MKLWLLRPIDGLPDDPWFNWYDKAFGFVVIAETEDDARDVASEDPGDEGGDAWRDANCSTCVELVAEGEARIVLRDFASA
jgi:hypothetical protein